MTDAQRPSDKQGSRPTCSLRASLLDVSSHSSTGTYLKVIVMEDDAARL
jgi:hypothetical protein